MTIVEFLSWLAFGVEVFGGVFAYLELSRHFDLLRCHGKVMGSYRHTVEHVFMLVLMIVCNLSLIIWLFHHKGFAHAWDIHIVGENLWIAIFLFGVLKVAIAKHLRDERIESFCKKS